MPPLVAKRMVVITPVSEEAINSAAKRTPKLMMKLTNQKSGDSCWWPIHNLLPGPSVVLGARTFLVLAGFAALTFAAFATGLAFAAFATGLAFAFGFVSSLPEAAALSSSPMLFTLPCRVRQFGGRHQSLVRRQRPQWILETCFQVGRPPWHKTPHAHPHPSWLEIPKRSDKSQNRHFQRNR